MTVAVVGAAESDLDMTGLSAIGVRPDGGALAVFVPEE